MAEKPQQLIFVYNADSNLFSLVTDFVHKIISPKTYQCNLCKITFGSLGVKSKWRSYIQSLQTPVKFLHKDEFVHQYPKLASADLPAVYKVEADKIKLIITSEEINSINSIDDLIALVDSKLILNKKQSIEIKTSSKDDEKIIIS
jgi:hypothetical protein